ncbi:Fibrinogen-like protein A,Ryncolin-2,Tenascin-X,Angiopoietin-related protein 6,Ficolin-2,Ryncolin-1,Ryncolin-3,Ficolin-1,Fibroleukin [Mytilus coruscus]|uniref:Fibrinogen-like protein A,Ryncolin-2,Tenascin-X,Angiopoietin-related protein 6,Ficolin-2,Ryncolin-1,Ryncolin-3,Ficolin-1,Fibroleukin n=1 Tax=Mytilus coruscus TaxID=42192 RepID=A0A6J8CP76_MYTCO|nr:Fibrinogen-like protein A,Ryncolin-2,Tenascin-X,Angiopoietin-related protein 6,Ficolin-2,Ryncolin-1,Ryncolin-3,Ficolin-1,Fibroleukin [Mytilus coruscus]
MEMYEAKIKTWEDSIPTNLNKLDDAKKQTETFLESMQDILYQEQTRLNGSFHETVENVYLKSESKVKSALDALSYKIDEYSESQNRRENVIKLLQSTFRQEQKRFKQEQTHLNDSFQETVENIYLQSEIKVKCVLDSLSTKIGEFENRSENALELLHSTLLQEQEQFNDSFQATVENIKTQSESTVKRFLDSISFKMNEYSESHRKRENALELLQSNLLQEQERFNQSFHLMMNNIKEDLNETIRNFISEQADDRDLPQECTDMFGVITGIRTISPDKIHKFKVRCEDGNWTVIQKRFSGETEFYRNWNDYENGFGNLLGEFWLGNRIITLLTSIGTHELRIDLEDWDGSKRYADFKNFKIDGISEKYRLHISGYSGNAGDGMTEYNGYNFSTYDRDYDTHSNMNCAAYEAIKGAWWFHSCWSGSGASLNGKYTSGPSSKAGIIYRYWQSNSLKKSTMMIRKV